MDSAKIQNEKTALIVLNILSTVLIITVTVLGLILVNKNKQIIAHYNSITAKEQQRYDAGKSDVAFTDVMKTWHLLGNGMASSDETIAFNVRLSGLVLIGTNIISLYYLTKRTSK